MDCNPPYSSDCGIISAKILEWVAISSLNLSDPGMEPESPTIPALAGQFFTTEPPGKPHLEVGDALKGFRLRK